MPPKKTQSLMSVCHLLGWGLALELDVIPNLCYKIDTNHDIIYMEFSRDVPSVPNLEALVLKLGLEALLVGQPPPKADSPQKTQRIY